MQICGIYKIENIINNKFYIGSSYDIGYRFKAHLSRLKNNKHTNNHLQNSFNKYGIECFKFSVVEECEKQYLLEREQYHIDNNDWNKLYNKTKIANGGGSDLVEIELYLLDLKGNIVNQYKSGVYLAIDLKLSITPYSTINTPAIVKKQYRIVTVKYYNQNLNNILSWKPYSNLAEYKKHQQSIPLYKLTKDNQEYNCFTLKETGDILNITSEAVRIMMKNINVKFHKKSGFTIASVKKKH